MNRMDTAANSRAHQVRSLLSYDRARIGQRTIQIDPVGIQPWRQGKDLLQSAGPHVGIGIVLEFLKEFTQRFARSVRHMTSRRDMDSAAIPIAKSSCTHAMLSLGSICLQTLFLPAKVVR